MNTLFGTTVGIWAALLAPLNAAAPTPDAAGTLVRTAAVGSAVVQKAEGDLEAIAEAEAAVGFRIVVSISERKLYVRDGDQTLGSYPVAVGKDKHQTPKGSYAIRRVIWNPRWVPPKVPWAKDKTAKAPGHPENPMGKVKMFFKDPDYYIHGTNDEGSLGRAASHGCLRMANSDVVEVAKLVMKHGGQPREQSWFQRVVNRVRSSEEVRLKRPVPVTIRA